MSEIFHRNWFLYQGTILCKIRCFYIENMPNTFSSRKQANTSDLPDITEVLQENDFALCTLGCHYHCYLSL